MKLTQCHLPKIVRIVGPAGFNDPDRVFEGFIRKEMFPVAEQFQLSNVFFSTNLLFLPDT